MWRNEQTQFGSNSKKSSDVDFSIKRVASSGDMTGLAEDTLEDTLDRELNDRFEKKARYQVATSRFSDESMQSTESVLRCMPGDIECDSTCHCDFPIVKVIEEIDYENLMTKFNATEVDVSVTNIASGCQSASSGKQSYETLLQEPSYESYGGPDETQPATREEIDAAITPIKKACELERRRRFVGILLPDSEAVSQKIGQAAKALDPQERDSGAVEFLYRAYGVVCFDHSAFLK